MNYGKLWNHLQFNNKKIYNMIREFVAFKKCS